MSFERKQIKKNMNLNVYTTDKFKSDYLCISFISEENEETYAKRNLIPIVLMQGSTNYKTRQAINRRCADLYSLNISAGTDNGDIHTTYFTLSCLCDKYVPEKNSNLFVESLELLADIMFNPLLINGEFSHSYVEIEKKNLCDAIKSKKNNKDYLAIFNCLKYVTVGTPYYNAINESCDDVMKITPLQLTEQFKSFYDNTVCEITYVGAKSLSYIEKTVLEYMKPLLSYQRDNVSVNNYPVKKSINVSHYSEEQMIKQSKLVIALQLDTDMSDTAAYLVFCEIFGYSTVSRLFMNIREKMSLCYYCSLCSLFEKNLLVVYAGINKENAGKVECGILSELEKLKNECASEEELDNAKKSIMCAYESIDDSSSAIAKWYLDRIKSGAIYSPLEIIEKIKGVTASEVRELAKKLNEQCVYLLSGCKGSNDVEGDDEIDL